MPQNIASKIMPQSPADRNSTIEAIRFFAALSVFFVHIPTVEVGHFGVDAFFVISGYVMMLSTKLSHEKFFLKRIIRIVPTYYFLTLGVFCIAVVYPSLLGNTTADMVHLIKSLMFIPFDKNGTGHAPVLFLGWTLNYEMFFYLLFAIALTVSHQHRAVVASVLIFSIWCLCSIADVFLTKVYGDLIVFEFMLGILLYLVLHSRRYSEIVPIVLLLVLAALISTDPLGSRLFYAGIPAACVIYVALRFFENHKMPGLIVLLGGASYALYLTHPYVIQLFDNITGLFDGSAIQNLLAIVLSLLIANLAAVILYKYIELPVTFWLRKRLLSTGNGSIAIERPRQGAA